MATFPLSSVPTVSYKTGGRKFGADRSKKKRKHAGCDLIASAKSNVYAVASGTILNTYLFYKGTYAIEVKHPQFIARYCEVEKPTLGSAKAVLEGQVIGRVGKMVSSSMLHFEMYDGTGSGSLTVRSNKPYQRRKDLIDPTPYLDKWQSNLPKAG